jgi:hypothetical protein
MVGAIAIQRSAKLPNGCGVKATTRFPIHASCDGEAASTTPTASWPETYGRAIGTGYSPVAIVTSGQASAAAATRITTKSRQGASPGARRCRPSRPTA